MRRSATVWVGNDRAGVLTRTHNGYEFIYDKPYLLQKDASPVSLSLPLQDAVFQAEDLFPFFDGLTQEGWLKEMSEKILHIDAADRFSLLVKNGADCIGNVSILEEP